jgi:hypothetical protein
MESEFLKLALVALLLTGCASADLGSPPPEWAVRILDETHKRVIVEHQEVWGNCATFAFTASILASQAGHPANIVQHGPSHVIAVAGGWAFDAQSGEPYPANP